MVCNNTLWNLKNAEQAAKDIQFWRAEYIKRQFLQEPQYEEIKKLCCDIKEKWIFYLKECKRECPETQDSSILTHLQKAHIAHLKNESYFYGEINLADFILRYDQEHAVHTFFNISMIYDYFVMDLLQITDMDAILATIDAELPAPPEFHVNKHFYQKFDENILTVLRLNPQVATEISASRESGWNAAIKEYCNSEFADTIKISCYARCADFAIIGNSLHTDFDIIEACKEIKDHIAWTIYEIKRKLNKPLKDEEEKAIIDLYKRMAIGEYGGTHRAARAIGLCLWDARYRFKSTQTDNAAVRALRNKKLDVEYQKSEDRTLLRLLANAKKCIDSGKVVAINKQSGRPKQTQLV